MAVYIVAESIHNYACDVCVCVCVCIQNMCHSTCVDIRRLLEVSSVLLPWIPEMELELRPSGVVPPFKPGEPSLQPHAHVFLTNAL